LCGQPWDECCGECQEWITVKKKAEYLKSVQIAKDLLEKERKETDETNIIR
jgi:hypothetical protein